MPIIRQPRPRFSQLKEGEVSSFAGRDVISIPKGAKYPDDEVAFLGASVRVPGLRPFNDPGAASVFGGIMRFTKRIGLFDLAWCARNKCHLTAYVGKMERMVRVQSDTVGFHVCTGFPLLNLL